VQDRSTSEAGVPGSCGSSSEPTPRPVASSRSHPPSRNGTRPGPGGSSSRG